MDELLKALEWYVKRLTDIYKVDRETAYKALAESLLQSSILERVYMDACYVLENRKA